MLQALVSAAFARADQNRDGSLPPLAALAVLREAVPTARNTVLCRVALALWMQDVEGTASVSLQCLLQVLLWMDD